MAALALGDAFSAPATRGWSTASTTTPTTTSRSPGTWSQGPGSTFDGILPTNGYHPLWLVALLPIFATVAGKLPALLAVKTLGALLFAASVATALVARAASSAASWRSPARLPILVFCRDLWLSGMETALLLPLLILAAARLLADGVLVRPDARHGPASWLLAAALAGAARPGLLGRLVALAAGLLPPGLNRAEKDRPRPAARPALRRRPAALHGDQRAAFRHRVAGVGPGQIARRPLLEPTGLRRLPGGKAGARSRLRAAAGGRARGCFSCCRPSPSAFYFGSRSEALRGATALLGVLVAANACQLLYYAVFSSWPLWRWYYYYLPIALALAVAMLAGLPLAALPPRIVDKLAWAILVADRRRLDRQAGLGLPLPAEKGPGRRRQLQDPGLGRRRKAEPGAAARRDPGDGRPRRRLRLFPRPAAGPGRRPGRFERLPGGARKGRGPPTAGQAGVDYVVYSGGEKAAASPGR